KTLAKFTNVITKRFMEDARHEAQRRLKAAALSESRDPYDLHFSSCTEPMRILVDNSGSSSLKFTLFDTTQAQAVLEGLVERIGTGDVRYRLQTAAQKWEESAGMIGSTAAAFQAMIATLT
ncbi:MAG: hypothetical protein N2Z74_01835, partial [Syntrophales bacterium]|nr:hypothetical protein [Syntrophales bacterium]